MHRILSMTLATAFAGLYVSVPSPPARVPGAIPADRVLVYDSASGLAVARRDGSGAITLPARRGSDWQPAWSPDGRRIAFVHISPGGRPPNSGATIWVEDRDGSARYQLTHHTPAQKGRNVIDQSPSWSPDGRQIAFCRIREPRPSTSSTWIVNSDGSDAHMIDAWNSDERAGSKCRGVAWSPDGSTLAVAAAFYITVMSPSGRIEGRLGGEEYQTNGYEGGVAWSPDGKDLAATGFAPTGPGGLYVIHRDGSRRLVAEADWRSQISWGWDGRIYYERSHDKPGTYETITNIYAVPAHGDGSPRLLVRNAWQPAVFP